MALARVACVTRYQSPLTRAVRASGGGALQVPVDSDPVGLDLGSVASLASLRQLTLLVNRALDSPALDCSHLSVSGGGRPRAAAARATSVSDFPFVFSPLWWPAHLALALPQGSAAG